MNPIQIASQNHPPTPAFIRQCLAEAHTLAHIFPNGEGELLSGRQILLLNHLHHQVKAQKSDGRRGKSGAFVPHDGRIMTAYWHFSRRNITLQQAWAHGFTDLKEIPEWNPYRANHPIRSVPQPSQIKLANAKAAQVSLRPDWVPPPPAALPPPPPPPPPAAASTSALPSVNTPREAARDAQRLPNNLQPLPSSPVRSHQQQQSTALTANTMAATIDRNTNKGNAGRSKIKTYSKKNNLVLDGFREAEGEYTEESCVESTTRRRQQPPQPSAFAIALPAPAVRVVNRKRGRIAPSSSPMSDDEEEYEPVPQRRRRRKSEVSGQLKAVVVDEDGMNIDSDEEDREGEVASNGKSKSSRDRDYHGSSLQERLERPVHLTEPYRADIGLYYGEPPRFGAAQATPSATRATNPASGIYSHSYDPGLQFASPTIFAQYKNHQYRNRTCRTTIPDIEQEEAEMIEWERATIARQQAKANMTATEYQRTTSKQTGMPAPKNFSPRISTPFLPDAESARYALENEYRGVPPHRLPAELRVHAQPTQYQKWKDHNREKMEKGNTPGWLQGDGYDESFLEEGPSTSPGGFSAVATPSHSSAQAVATPSTDGNEVSGTPNINNEATPSLVHATAAATSSQGNVTVVDAATSKKRSRTSALTAEEVRAAVEAAPHNPDEIIFYERIPGIQTPVLGHASPVIEPYGSHIHCDSMTYRTDRAIREHPNFQIIKPKMRHQPTPEVPNIIFYKAMWYSAHNTKELRESRNFVPKVPKLSLDRWDGLNHLACHFTTVEKFTVSNVIEFITNAYHFYPHKPTGEDELHAELVVVPESVKLRWKRDCGNGKQDEVITTALGFRWRYDVEDIQADTFLYGTLILEFGVRNINESERQKLLSS